MSIHGVVPSLSPSMDIQVSSNFERLLFELLDRDATACARIMTEFRKTGVMKVADPVWDRAHALFHGVSLDDAATLAEIRTLNNRSHYLADPHTAIGIAAGRAFREPGIPMVAMATAHPAKFPDAMAQATGIRPALPAVLADLYDRPERYSVVPADLNMIEDRVRAAVMTNAG